MFCHNIMSYSLHEKFIYRNNTRFDVAERKNVPIQNLSQYTVLTPRYVFRFLFDLLNVFLLDAWLHVSDSSLLHEGSLSSYSTILFLVTLAMWAFPHG